MLGALVSDTGPKEPAKSVALVSRNDVSVKVRDALTYPVVDRKEYAAGLGSSHHGSGDGSTPHEKAQYEIVGEFQEIWHVPSRYYKRMAHEQRPSIEKRSPALALPHPVGINLAPDDFAEATP